MGPKVLLSSIWLDPEGLGGVEITDVGAVCRPEANRSVAKRSVAEVEGIGTTMMIRSGRAFEISRRTLNVLEKGEQTGLTPILYSRDKNASRRKES